MPAAADRRNLSREKTLSRITRRAEVCCFATVCPTLANTGKRSGRLSPLMLGIAELMGVRAGYMCVNSYREFKILLISII